MQRDDDRTQFLPKSRVDRWVHMGVLLVLLFLTRAPAVCGESLDASRQYALATLIMLFLVLIADGMQPTTSGGVSRLVHGIAAEFHCSSMFWMTSVSEDVALGRLHSKEDDVGFAALSALPKSRCIPPRMLPKISGFDEDMGIDEVSSPEEEDGTSATWRGRNAAASALDRSKQRTRLRVRLHSMQGGSSVRRIGRHQCLVVTEVL